MSLIDDLKGTISNLFRVGLTGVNLKSVAGSLFIRNTVDNADASLSALSINATSVTESTSSTTGAIVTNGGIGSAKNIVSGGSLCGNSAMLKSGIFASTITPVTLTDNRSFALPNKNGTLATIDDITAAVGVQRLFVSNVASAGLTGSIVETTFVTYVIPANTVGANGCLDIEVLVQISNSTNAKTLRVKIGANVIFAPVLTNGLSFSTRRILRNQNSQTSQVITPPTGLSGFGVSTVAVSTFAIDFTVEQTLTITGQLAIATESMSLRGASILLY